MVARTGQPGLALALTDRDTVLLTRTYGAADVATGAPVAPETLFEIGSIGKSFTAVLVLQLAEAGASTSPRRSTDYLPWFHVPQPPGARPITVAHLLSHTAGIVAGADATPEAAFQVWALRDTPARSAPGERFHYSNVGYKALGLVLEAIEGRRYPELLRERILDPLGMTASEPAITNDMRERLAVGYEYGLATTGSATPAPPRSRDLARDRYRRRFDRIDRGGHVRLRPRCSCATATGRTADSSARPRSPGCASPTSTRAKSPATATGSESATSGATA